jgi:tetratricopeptide (TPR) repeat protein
MNLTIDDLEEMLSDARKEGDLHREATYLSSLGGEYRNRGQAWKAIAYYENAFKTWQLLGEWLYMAQACRHMADIYQWLLSDMEKAIYYQELAVKFVPDDYLKGYFEEELSRMRDRYL